MKKNLYAVRDNLTLQFEHPVCFETELACLRAITSQIVTEKTKFEQRTIDYDPNLQHASRSIYFIGRFDDDTGCIEKINDPVLLCVLSDAPNLYQKMLTEFK